MVSSNNFLYSFYFSLNIYFCDFSSPKIYSMLSTNIYVTIAPLLAYIRSACEGFSDRIKQGAKQIAIFLELILFFYDLVETSSFKNLSR